MSASDDLKRKLQWQCRRGMLEIDVMLQPFLEQQFLNLSETDQQIFERLLTENDQDLFDWLLGKDSPQDTELATMVGKIRDYASKARA